MTDTEREALCARIDELCAEVERLRKQLHDQKDTAEHNFVRNAREYKRVCDENAELRELVRWMYDRMDESCAVQHPYAPAPISYDRLIQAAARAHELGVEVN